MLVLDAIALLGQFDGSHHHDVGDGSWWVMWIGMILFWILIALAVVWLVREVIVPRRHGSSSENAMEILERRLAEGEISTEEYQERRKALQD